MNSAFIYLITSYCSCIYWSQKDNKCFAESKTLLLNSWCDIPALMNRRQSISGRCYMKQLYWFLMLAGFAQGRAVTYQWVQPAWVCSLYSKCNHPDATLIRCMQVAKEKQQQVFASSANQTFDYTFTVKSQCNVWFHDFWQTNKQKTTFVITEAFTVACVLITFLCW